MAKSKFSAFAVDKRGPEPAAPRRIGEEPKKKALVQVATERLTLYVTPEDAKRFKMLKAELGCSGPDLAAEMLALLFAKHSKKN
jgi:hypothetical protein